MPELHLPTDPGHTNRRIVDSLCDDFRNNSDYLGVWIEELVHRSGVFAGTTCAQSMAIHLGNNSGAADFHPLMVDDYVF